MTLFRIKVITVDGVVITLHGKRGEEESKDYISEKLAGNNLFVPSEKGFTFLPASQIKRIEAERINDE